MNQQPNDWFESNGKFPRLMKASEIAKVLHVSRAQAYKLLQTGAIPRYEFGGCIRAREEDVREYFRKHYRREISCNPNAEESDLSAD